MSTTSCVWIGEVARGPNWLFVRLEDNPAARTEESPLSDVIRELLAKHFLNRVVIELDDLPRLPPGLLDELQLLGKSLAEQDGLVRLSGIRPTARVDLGEKISQPHLPCYHDRCEAITSRKREYGA